MRWTVVLEGGPRRVNHAAVSVGDKIYSFGGYCSSDEYSDWEPMPVHELDTRSLRWTVPPWTTDASTMKPFERYGHTAVAYKHKVYMWGGRNNHIACEALLCYDTCTRVWSTPRVSGAVPFTKDGHTACVIDNKIYIFGGFEYSTDQYSQEVHSLDLETHEWRYIQATGTPPSHRDFHSAVGIGSRMYVWGGRGYQYNVYNNEEELYCKELYYLDTKTNHWHQVQPQGTAPPSRRSHSAWLYKGDMYVFGGYNGNTHEHFNDLHCYSLEDNTWRELHVLGAPPHKRRRQAAVNIYDKVYLFGGTSPSNAAVPAELSGERDERDKLTLVDNSDLHVLDCAPTLYTLALLAVTRHRLDTGCLPVHIQYDIKAMTTPNKISRPLNRAG